MNASDAVTEIEASRAAYEARTRTPVSESALVQRLRRHHAAKGEAFHITRSRWFRDLGYWLLMAA